MIDIITDPAFTFGVVTGIVAFLLISFMLMWLVVIDGEETDK